MISAFCVWSRKSASIETMRVIYIFSDKFIVLAFIFRFMVRVVVSSGIARGRTQNSAFPRWCTVLPAPCAGNFLAPAASLRDPCGKPAARRGVILSPNSRFPSAVCLSIFVSLGLRSLCVVNVLQATPGGSGRGLCPRECAPACSVSTEPCASQWGHG